MKSNNKSTQIKQNYSIIKYIFQLFQLLNISIKMHSHLGCKTSHKREKPVGERELERGEMDGFVFQV